MPDYTHLRPKERPLTREEQAINTCNRLYKQMRKQLVAEIVQNCKKCIEIEVKQYYTYKMQGKFPSYPSLSPPPRGVYVKEKKTGLFRKERAGYGCCGRLDFYDPERNKLDELRIDVGSKYREPYVNAGSIIYHNIVYYYDGEISDNPTYDVYIPTKEDLAALLADVNAALAKDEITVSARKEKYSTSIFLKLRFDADLGEL